MIFTGFLVYLQCLPATIKMIVTFFFVTAHLEFAQCWKPPFKKEQEYTGVFTMVRTCRVWNPQHMNNHWTNLGS